MRRPRRGRRGATAHAFLSKLFTIADMLERIEAQIRQPRRLGRASDYFGPDRRRRADPARRGGAPGKRAAHSPSAADRRFRQKALDPKSDRH